MAASSKTTLATLGGLLVLVVLGVVLMGGYGRMVRVADAETYLDDSPASRAGGDLDGPQRIPGVASGVIQGASVGTEAAYADFSPGAAGATPAPGGCFPRDRLTAEDLLPKGSANSEWAQQLPQGQGSLGDKNFLEASWHIGVSSGNLRNASYDLRSTPSAPKIQPSIWNLSTIDPGQDTRKPLE